jgi:hypothetical protein
VQAGRLIFDQGNFAGRLDEFWTCPTATIPRIARWTWSSTLLIDGRPVRSSAGEAQEVEPRGT